MKMTKRDFKHAKHLKELSISVKNMSQWFSGCLAHCLLLNLQEGREEKSSYLSPYTGEVKMKKSAFRPLRV